MSRFLSWLLALSLPALFAAVALVVLDRQASAGRGMPPYSVYSSTDRGLGEAADLLDQLGWTAVAVTRPIEQTRCRGLLIIAEPQSSRTLTEDETSFRDSEIEALLRWVERGNTLLLCSDRNTALHQALGVTVTEAARVDEETEVFTPVELEEDSPYTDDIDRLSVHSTSTLSASAKALPLWTVHGRPGALLLERGKGRVLVVADPDLLTPRGLRLADGTARDDNVMFLINVVRRDARDGRVYFDEYHHGFHSTGGFMGYLAHHGQRWALLPLLIVVGAGLWCGAVRLGPAVPVPRAASADAVDYASALARLYQRAGARRLLARGLARGFLADLTRYLRLRRNALPAVILAAWQRHVGAGSEKPAGEHPSTARLRELLRGVAELRRGDLDDRALLAWARDFDAFTQQMRVERRRAKAAAWAR